MRRSLCALALLATTPPAARADDLPPELPVSVYQARRERLMTQLRGCNAVLRSRQEETDGGPMTTPDFFYLTGIDEPGAALVLTPRAPMVRTTILLSPRDPESEIWEGYREPMSPSLRHKYGVDRVGRTGHLAGPLLSGLRRSRCLARIHGPFTSDEQGGAGKGAADLMSAFEARTEQRWEALEHMRAVKDAEEIRRMERAIAITAEGHRAAALGLRKGTTERQVSADLENAFYRAGATGLAFPSIVAAGPNGAVLHWTRKDRAIEEGDLAVVDIGASYGGYAADVTRTLPVSGTFSAEQRAVYDAVLAAQDQALAALKPGVSLERLNQIAEDSLTAAGYELPHFVGHFVGLEVHDVGDTGAPLEPGMVITVEPGVYLQGKLGVRIEDMYLVTKDGYRHLSNQVPRKAEELEAWMKEVRAARP